MPDKTPIVWDKEAVKWLLKDPVKLQHHPGCWQWVLESGGLKGVQRYLRTLPLPSDAARLLQVMLDDPRQQACIYADRLNLSESTYYRRLKDLVALLLIVLNQRVAEPPEPSSASGATLRDETTEPRPQQALLPQMSLFIGRDTEILALRELLCRPQVRLVTLTGPGGIGKTCLSIAVASELGDAFADGIVFVSLAAIRDPELLGSALIQALGLERAGTKPDLELLIGHLRERALLLVLDNFEQLVAAASLLGTLLGVAPRLKLLVTSRSVLRLSSEVTVLVPPLSLPQSLPAEDDDHVVAALTQYEAIRLFVERAQDMSPGFRLTRENAWAVAEICQQLDGLPLAIELAAARIKVLSPAAIVARIQHRLALLTRGPIDLPARQQTLRHTLDWSYDLLSPSSQALFRQLAVFTGGCTLEAVCVVCQLAEEQALAGLEELIDQSMLQIQDHLAVELRYTMLETIREYAEERLEQRGEATTLRPCHAAFYLAMAEAAEPELTSGLRQKYWYDRLLQEYGNIRAALSWSLAGHAAEVGVALVAALWKLWSTYNAAEGRTWLALALDRSVGWESPQRCTLLYGAGWFNFTRANLPTAEALFEEALVLARRLNFERGIGMALHGVGELLAGRGEYVAAARCYEESLEIFQDLGDQEEIAWSLAHLGSVCKYAGDVAEAARHYQESIALFRKVEQQHGLFWTMCSLAEVLPDQDTRQLRGLIEESLAWFRVLGDRTSTAWALVILGMLAVDEAQLNEAQRRLDEALVLFREREDTPGLTATLCCQGHVALDRNHLTDAAHSYRESLTLRHKLDAPSGIAECLEGLAAVALRQGDARQAALLAGAAEALLLAAHARQLPFALRRSQRTLALIRAALPPQAFDVAWAEGQTTPLEQIIQVGRCR